MPSNPATTLAPAEKGSVSQKGDLLTVAAIGILAFICTDVAHEVVGHGTGLLAAGGRSGVLTTTRLIYASPLPNPNWRVFDLGGPVGNLTWAGLCFFAQRLMRSTNPPLRLFLWSSMCFSLFWEFGYLIQGAVTGHGDPMALIAGLMPGWVWRSLLFVTGIVLYRAAMSVVSSEFHFIQSVHTPQWHSRTLPLIITLCAASLFIACAGPLFDPRGRIEILKSGAPSALASWVALLTVPSLFPSYPDEHRVADGPVRRNILVMILAACAAAFYVAILGPGIAFKLP